MQYKINDKPKSKKEIEVTISPKAMENCMIRAAEKLCSESPIKGFRPGKAPFNIVKKTFGDTKLWNEGCYDAINKSYFKIIEKEGIEVISPPQVEIVKMVVNEPLEYKATVEFLPEIQLPDYKKIAKDILKDKKEVKVSAKEVENTLKSIQKSRAKTVRVTRKSKKGDEVVINFQGKIDGVAQESLKAEAFPIIIGETQFIDGFEKEITDVKEGEKKIFSVEIPITENEKKRVEFEVDIISVNEKELPKIDDDFAKSLGEFKDAKDLKIKIEENIKLEKENKEQESIRIKIIEEIGNKSNVDLPEILIEKETEYMLQEFKAQITQSGGSFEDYLKRINKKEEDIKKEWTPQAKKRIMVSLVLQKIGELEKIKINPEEIETELNLYLSRFGNELKDTEIDNIKIHISNMLKNRKVFEILEK
ncbi:MAG TPA: trigger factor [Candidatus Pacearchaeota archaeon]|nr:trigger factor [Candidatus Pacearchaeota archaeon]